MKSKVYIGIGLWIVPFIMLDMPIAHAAAATAANKPGVLRVCADPNNMPFSNQAKQGLENKLAELIAADMDAKVEYTWWAQRRGFLRETLNAGKCDVVMGIPAETPMALTTKPYYRSSYVIVSKADKHYDIRSLGDPRLAHLRIGVHLIGKDSPPPALVLARRGIVNNVVGYSIYGDYRTANPPQQLIEAVENGDIDVAIAWGPLAGYLAKGSKIPLQVTALSSPEQNRQQLPFEFSISMGVRPGDQATLNELNTALTHQTQAVQALLDAFNVPQVATANGTDHE
ncbi:MAG TPA: substrate-binding domain-containing protein [Methylophilaceae bacterium]